MRKVERPIELTFKDAKKVLKDLLGGTRPQTSFEKQDFKVRNKFLASRMNEKIAIEKENLRISEKIGSVRSSFSVKAWKKDYDKSRKYFNIKQKTSRPSSRISAKRTLIDTVNLVMFD